MADPITLDIPHTLGRDTARARIDGGIDKLAGMFPGGGQVEKHWEGESLHFTITAMGQKVKGRLEPKEESVHAELQLPLMLQMFAAQVREKLAKEAPKLLQ